MAFINNHILSFIIFLPLAGAIAIMFIHRDKTELIQKLTLILTSLVFLLSLPLFFGFNASSSTFQFVEQAQWIKSIGISYHVGIDGISVLMVLLTTFLTPLVVLSSWSSIKTRIKEYMIVLLMLETGMIGVFCALDLFLFYIFWEGMLIPMYFIIGIWGGTRKIYATIKFFLFTMLGGVLMLVAIMVLFFIHAKQFGSYSFDYSALKQVVLTSKYQIWLFLAFSIAFAIKVPMFPFHTWLPDAHVEAPTGGSVILAGILLKMGTYGFLRFCIPFFPNAADFFVEWISAIAIVGIIYGALVAMVQPDIKKLVAYSSISHLGFVMLGVFAFNTEAIQGSIIQMVNHGLSTGALFLLVGMIYERRHTRNIADFGGLARKMPVFVTIFMIITMSSIGLPGLNGFVGEFLILAGTFKTHKLLAILATSGVILAAVYMLWMFQRVNFGKLDKPENQVLKDLNLREIVVLVPIVLFCFWIGIYSSTFLQKTEATVNNVLMEAAARKQMIMSLEQGIQDSSQSRLATLEDNR